MIEDDERRVLPRVAAPVLCRTKRRGLFAPRRRAIDVSLGGIRIYSDERMSMGQQLELEIQPPNETSTLACEAEVVWVVELEEGADAKFDIGLRFITFAKDDRKKLNKVLAPSGEDGSHESDDEVRSPSAD